MAKKNSKQPFDGYAKALRRIEECRQQRGNELDLNQLGLTVLPPEISQLTSLTALNLMNNRLSTLPPEIGRLSLLRTLDLFDNKLSTLPPEILQLKWLTTLDLGINQLSILPPEIGQLTLLTMLDLRSNQLSTLPRELDRLKSLKILRLGHNQFSTLPPEIGQLTSLESLESAGNELSTLPPEIAKLTSLKSLDLARNQLSTLPPEIVHLTSLEFLGLAGNRLSRLPPEIVHLTSLESLDLTGNQLSRLPPEIVHLTSLESLDLTGNQLSTLPPEIVHLTSLELLDLESNQLSTLPPEIGKLKLLTTLRLRNNQLKALPPEIGQLFNLKELRLDRNNLLELPDTLRKLSQLEQLTLHKNEFLNLSPDVLGPDTQEILLKGTKPSDPQHLLDYYFRLRKGSKPLNEFKLILVGHGQVGKTALVNQLIRNEFIPTDMTRGIHIEPWKLATTLGEVAAHVWDFGGQDIMHGTHQFFLTRRSLYLLVLAARESKQNDDAEYWLKTISAFGGNSSVIVVLNKSEERPFDLNENALRKKYPAIKNFIKTDCLSGMGMDDLRAAICNATESLEGLRDPFPASWFAIKERLSGMQENYLTFAQFREECNSLGEQGTNDQEVLADVLHVLGIALNFRDDDRLRETSVLNPLWVTGGLYSLLNDNDLAKRHGLLKLQDFTRVLPKSEYPLETHGFLLELMGKFELCFPVEGTKQQFLIPELLGEQEPDKAGPLDTNNSLAFSYFYPRMLPHGLVPRFIVRLYQIIKDELRWRTGAVLEWFEAVALVKADEDDRCIRIRVHGNQKRRRELLGIIREEFDVLHRQFHGLLPREVIHLPQYPEVSVDYSHVEAAARAGMKQMPIFTDGNMIQVDPDALLREFEVQGEERDAGNRGASEVEPTPPPHHRRRVKKQRADQ